MQLVTLSTGEQVPASLLNYVVYTLDRIKNSSTETTMFPDLFQLACNPEHRLIGKENATFRQLNLIGADGQMQDVVRSIIRAAIEDNKGELCVISPMIEQPPIAQKIQDLYDFEFYTLMRRIENIVFEYFVTSSRDRTSQKPWLDDCRNMGIDSSRHQTASGLYLAIGGNYSQSLWTPWGERGFAGGRIGSWDNILPELFERFGATLHRPLRDVKNIGGFGPTYALHKVDDIPLPEPIELDRAVYDSSEDLEAAWKEMNKQYNK
jgi:hypothetical protein